jgi:hypothetical protein
MTQRRSAARVADRPTTVGDNTELIATKQPLARCDEPKLWSSAPTEGVRWAP